PAGETAQRIGRGPGAEAPRLPPLSITTKRTSRLLAWMSFFLFQNEGQGAAHRGGHTSPLFWSMGRQNLRFRTSLKTVGLRPTTRKFFEKNLTKNFYVSPPNPSAGL